MGKERVGSWFKPEAPVGTPSLLSNLLRHKKSSGLISQGHLEAEREGNRPESSVSAPQFLPSAELPSAPPATESELSAAELLLQHPDFSSRSRL